MANTKITNPELFNLGDSTSATQLPVMTTTERIAMNAPPTFNIDYLVVAGGGGGGSASSGYAGGGAGGAGGYRTSYGTGNISGGNSPVESALNLTIGPSHTITVGDGGAGGPAASPITAAPPSGTKGDNSVFASITSEGGGYGVGQNQGTGGSGGSAGGGGGGSSPGSGGTGTSSQGSNGGTGTSNCASNACYLGGGGGGASQAGSSVQGGKGGDGLSSSITETSVIRAGGGSGGSYGPIGWNDPIAGGAGGGGDAGVLANGFVGQPGSANTGGGGGGATWYTGENSKKGGDGGSGVVILRYTTADVTSYTATGLIPTETTVGTDTILSFTTVGTGTITFTSSTPTGTISTGEMIFNSTTDKVEYWDGTKWYGITYEAVVPVIPSNSVVFLDPSNINSYPGTGTTWTDLSTSGSDATLFNTSFSGTAGTNGYFNMLGLSSNSRLNTTGNSLVGWGNNVTSSLSISIWYYPTQTSGFGYVYSKTRSNGYEYALIDEPSQNRIWFLTWTSSGSLVSAAYINSLPARNSWHNIIVTLEYPQTSNGMKLYINNATGNGTVATGSSVRNYSSSSAAVFSIGSRADLNTYSFIGRVSKLSCYNTVLTQTEMADIFNAGSGA